MPNPTVLLKKRCSKPGQYFPRHPSSVPLPRPALARIPGGKLFFPCVGRLLKRGLFAADSKQRILVLVILVTWFWVVLAEPRVPNPTVL